MVATWSTRVLPARRAFAPGGQTLRPLSRHQMTHLRLRELREQGMLRARAPPRREPPPGPGGAAGRRRAKIRGGGSEGARATPSPARRGREGGRGLRGRRPRWDGAAPARGRSRCAEGLERKRVSGRACGSCSRRGRERAPKRGGRGERPGRWTYARGALVGAASGGRESLAGESTVARYARGVLRVFAGALGSVVEACGGRRVRYPARRIVALDLLCKGAARVWSTRRGSDVCTAQPSMFELCGGAVRQCRHVFWTGLSSSYDRPREGLSCLKPAWRRLTAVARPSQGPCLVPCRPPGKRSATCHFAARQVALLEKPPCGALSELRVSSLAKPMIPETTGPTRPSPRSERPSEETTAPPQIAPRKSLCRPARRICPTAVAESPNHDLPPASIVPR